MDEKYRQCAKQYMQQAKNLEYAKISGKSVLEPYLQAIASFLKIENKTLDDVTVLSKAYYSVAIIHFNTREYAKAAQAYLDSIAQLQQTELNDETYRTITERYIDLADTCYELSKQQAGNEAMTNAIKAFGMIKNKNSQELAIGDPIANFKQFRDYYEQQLSTASYFKSVKFINHGALLAEQQQERALTAQFEGISVGDMKKIDDSIETMLGLLSVAQAPAQSSFSAVAVGNAPSDSECRHMAMNLLGLAKPHIRNGLITHAIKTYEQVIEVLGSIKQANGKDAQIIQELQQQINFLKNKPTQVASAASFFGQAASAVVSDAERMEDEEEMEDSPRF